MNDHHVGKPGARDIYPAKGPDGTDCTARHGGSPGVLPHPETGLLDRRTWEGLGEHQAIWRDRGRMCGGLRLGAALSRNGGWRPEASVMTVSGQVDEQKMPLGRNLTLMWRAEPRGPLRAIRLAMANTRRRRAGPRACQTDAAVTTPARLWFSLLDSSGRGQPVEPEFHPDYPGNTCCHCCIATRLDLVPDLTVSVISQGRGSETPPFRRPTWSSPIRKNCR